MIEDITIMRHRDATGTVLTFDFLSDRPTDAWIANAQMFTTLLLTEQGSVPSDPKCGTTFMSDLRSGRIYSDALLKAGFEFAAQDIFKYLNTKGYTYRDKPEDKLMEVVLLQWGFTRGGAMLVVEMVNGLNERINYSLPIRL